MENLITIVEDEPRVSYRVVAEHTENQQKLIAELENSKGENMTNININLK